MSRSLRSKKKWAIRQPISRHRTRGDVLRIITDKVKRTKDTISRFTKFILRRSTDLSSLTHSKAREGFLLEPTFYSIREPSPFLTNEIHHGAPALPCKNQDSPSKISYTVCTAGILPSHPGRPCLGAPASFSPAYRLGRKLDPCPSRTVMRHSRLRMSWSHTTTVCHSLDYSIEEHMVEMVEKGKGVYFARRLDVGVGISRIMVVASGVGFGTGRSAGGVAKRKERR